MGVGVCERENEKERGTHTYTDREKARESERSYGISLWGGYGQQDRLNYRSLLQNIVSFIGLFCKRDL